MKKDRMNMISDVELSYKRTELPAIQITSSLTAAVLARTTIPENQIALREFFGLLLLSRSNRVLSKCLISSGGLSATVVDPKNVLQYVLLANAGAVILFHNHPGGEVRPSENDIRLTRKLKEACLIMEVSLLDHMILSGFKDSAPNYFSFADQGLL